MRAAHGDERKLFMRHPVRPAEVRNPGFQQFGHEDHAVGARRSRGAAQRRRFEAGHPAPSQGLQSGQVDLRAAQQRRVDAGDVFKEQGKRQDGEMALDRHAFEARTHGARGIEQSPGAEANAFGRPRASGRERQLGGAGRKVGPQRGAAQQQQAVPCVLADELQAQGLDALRLVGQHQVGAGFVQRMRDLRCAEEGRQRQMRRARLQARQVGDRPLRAVVGENRQHPPRDKVPRERLHGIEHIGGGPALRGAVQANLVGLARLERVKGGARGHACLPSASNARRMRPATTIGALS